MSLGAGHFHLGTLQDEGYLCIQYPVPINLENPFADGVSTTRAIAGSIRNAIVAGVLLSGGPLKQEELARHFGVSRIPVREALRQLESEGWVTFLRNKGAFVRNLSIVEARETYEILASLECTALKIALPKHTPETFAAIRDLLQQAHQDRGSGRETLHNLRFHMSLYAPAERVILMEMIDGVRRRSERYLRLKLSMDEQWEQSEWEHRDILNACEAGDERHAVSLLERHLLGTGEMLVRHFDYESRRRNIKSSDSLAALQREAAQHSVSS
jgi:DNA-binding GntR family transcriptional regulator